MVGIQLKVSNLFEEGVSGSFEHNVSDQMLQECYVFITVW